MDEVLLKPGSLHGAFPEVWWSRDEEHVQDEFDPALNCWERRGFIRSLGYRCQAAEAIVLLVNGRRAGTAQLPSQLGIEAPVVGKEIDLHADPICLKVNSNRRRLRGWVGADDASIVVEDTEVDRWKRAPFLDEIRGLWNLSTVCRDQSDDHP